MVRPDCFVWVALFEPDDDELAQMAEEFGLHELAVEDARKGHQRPKIEEYGSSMFAVLQTVDIDPASARRRLHRRRGRRLRRSQLRAVGPPQVAARASRTSARAPRREPENLARGSGFVLYAIMDTVVDRYFPVLARLEADLERLETEIFRGVPSAVQHRGASTTSSTG